MSTTRSRRSWLAVSAALASASFVLAGCSSSGSADSGDSGDSDPIVIGVASAQTGFFSGFDGPVKNAIDLAVAKVNADGGLLGRQLEVVVSDTKSDVELSASAAIDVLDQGADFVVTMCDYNLGAPAATEAQKAGKIALSCAGSALFGPVGVGPLAFSVNESSTTQASVGAQFASDQGWKTAYLLGDTGEDFTSSWCAAFKETFTDLGGEIVGEDTFVQGDTTVAPQVSTLSSSGVTPDVIALCGYPPTGSTAVGQLRSAGITAPIVTTSGFDGPGWLEAVPGVSDVYAVASASIYGDDPNPDINDLVASYTEEYGDPATSYLVYGDAMVQEIVDAVTKAGSTEGTEVGAALDAFSEQETILGPTTYTAGCHVALGRPMRIIEYGEGTGAYLDTVTASTKILPEGCTE
jgi:branched-chain amino acid transport system substrate-binding protein